MMTRVCDLPHDLVGEKILTKVPITSLREIRSTCKLWDALSKDFIVGRSRHDEFVGFITIENKVCSLRFDLQGVPEDLGLVHSSTKLVSILDGFDIHKVLHYDSLVLCISWDSSELVVWNPYLGQTKLIEPPPSKANMHMYGLGHINNNYKILRLGSRNGYGRVIDSEIYDSTTDSWSVVDLNPECDMDFYQRGVTLKGRTTYFFARGRMSNEIFVICFDYTEERFRPHHLPLPFISENKQAVVLSCVGENKLAVLYENRQTKVMEIWVTNKIASDDAVSWSKFLKVDTRSIQLAHDSNSVFYRDCGSFFIDEEKKVVVVFINGVMMNSSTRDPTKAYILGEEGYIESLKIESPLNVKPIGYYFPFMSSSYLPSLLQLSQPTNP